MMFEVTQSYSTRFAKNGEEALAKINQLKSESFGDFFVWS